MEALPATRGYLTFVGVDTGLPVNKYLLVWWYIIRIFSILMTLSLIIFQVYNILFLDTVYLMACTQIALYSLELVTYIRVVIKSRKVFPLLDQAFQLLDKEQIVAMRKFDKRHFLIKLGYGVICMILGTAYFLVKGIGPESTALAVAIRKSVDMSDTIVILFITAFALDFVLFALLIQAYVSVLNVMETIASQTQSTILRSRSHSPPDYELILRSLEWYNELMQAVNECIGMLPFAVLGMMFVYFSCGITFLITSGDELHISPAFAALSVGFSNVVYIIFTYEIIQKASTIWKSMSRCWKNAGDCVSEPVVGLTPTKESLEMRKSLKFFLTTEKAIEVKACDTIAMDRSLILSFLSQLIPLTVMMFTTVKEFDRKSQKTV